MVALALEYANNTTNVPYNLAWCPHHLGKCTDGHILLSHPVHEVEAATWTAQLLGWRIDGVEGLVAPMPGQAWKLRLSLPEVCKRGHVSGRDIKDLVGRAFFVVLLRRDVLSDFAPVYTFSRRHYGK